jgi:Na+/H+-dicarboxylate symporter
MCFPNPIGSPPGFAGVAAAGYSLNLDGATLYLTVTWMFVAQAAGVHGTIWEQQV